MQNEGSIKARRDDLVIATPHDTQEDTMKNIDLQIKDGKLVMTVDLSKDFGPSSTGKSIIIASTEGNVSAPGREDVKIGINIYRKR